jgi:hypothetical protein
MWQMAIDVCLVTSILVMSFRMAKSSRIQALLPRVAELEARVTKLITEAELAAKGVHDQLLRREQNISRYVSELEAKEKDMSSALNEGESLTKELSLMCETARREVHELASAISEVSRRRADSFSAQEPRATERRRSSPSELRETSEFEEDDRPQFSTRTRSRRASEWLEPTYDQQEEIAESSTQVERSSVQRLHDLYQTAESMLKSGRKAKEVSERTKLPFEGVERLAQMIEIEREEKAEKQKLDMARTERDSRLGALAASRRPSSTY